MSDRTNIHVVPGDDGWRVEKPGAKRASAVTDTQQQAIDRARQIAQNDGRAEVFIHGRDGQIRDKRTYGDDPRDIKG